MARWDKRLASLWDCFLYGRWNSACHRVIRWRPSGDLVGYVLNDPFDELLRRLSPSYMDAAFSRISRRIEAAGWNTNGLRFGCMHSGRAVVEASPHVPTAFHGWLWFAGRWPSEEEAARLAEGLAEGSPRLLFGGCYRTWVYDCPPNDGALTLRAMCEGTMDECPNWDPTWLGPGLEPGSLFARIVEAYGRFDESGLAAALLEAQREYSPDGYRLLRKGIALWLHEQKKMKDRSVNDPG